MARTSEQLTNAEIDVVEEIAALTPGTNVIMGNGNGSWTTSQLPAPNLVANGNFDDWPEGTSFTKTSDPGPYFTASLWYGSQIASGVQDEISSREDDGEDGYCYQIRQYKSSGFSGGHSWLCQIIPSHRLQNLKGRKLTLSFEHRVESGDSAFSGAWLVQLRYKNSGNFSSADISSTQPGLQGDGYVPLNGSDYEEFRSAGSTTSTWEKYSATITVPSSADSLLFNIVSLSNSTNDARVQMRKVYIHEGNVPLPFEYYGGSYAADQYEQMRQWNSTYLWGTAPGSLTYTGSMSFSGTYDVNGNATFVDSYPVPMIGVPSYTFYRDNSATTATWIHSSNGGAYTTFTPVVEVPSNTSARIKKTGGTATQSVTIAGFVVRDARL